MSMLDAYAYEVKMEWSGGAQGRLGAQGFPDLEVSAPPEFHGEPGRWTPEHLLAASVASCFAMTFLSIVRFQKLSVHSFRVGAVARLEKLPGEGYRFTEITLQPEISAAREHLEKVQKAIEKAEKNCFVTKSLRATVQVEARLLPAESEVPVQSHD